MAIFPGAIATDVDLYLVSNNLGTVLTAGIDAVVTTIPVVSTTGFPTTGWITIEQEAIQYTGITGTSFTGCTRGAGGTVAAAHLIGLAVKQTVVAAHHNSLKDETKAIEQFIADVLGLTTAVTASEFEFINGVTSNIQTQLNLKAPLASPTFTGTVTIPTPFTLGATSVTASGAEMNFLVGVTSSLQTQLNAKAPLASPTFSGTVTSTGPILSTDATANSITAQASVNGTNPRIRAVNTNGTSGQNRTSIISAVGDNNNVEVSIQAGKDSSNNNIELVGGTTKLSLGFGGTEYARVVAAGLTFPDHAVQGIVGTNTNNNALAGNVGQYIESTVIGQSVGTSGQYEDVTSISLTAGDWDISAMIQFNANGATVTNDTFGISSTSGNSSAGLIGGVNSGVWVLPNSTTGTIQTWTIPAVRVSLAGTTTYYIKSFKQYSVATPQVGARISARRVR